MMEAAGSLVGYYINTSTESQSLTKTSFNWKKTNKQKKQRKIRTFLSSVCQTFVSYYLYLVGNWSNSMWKVNSKYVRKLWESDTFFNKVTNCHKVLWTPEWSISFFACFECCCGARDLLQLLSEVVISS